MILSVNGGFNDWNRKCPSIYRGQETVKSTFLSTFELDREKFFLFPERDDAVLVFGDDAAGIGCAGAA